MSTPGLPPGRPGQPSAGRPEEIDRRVREKAYELFERRGRAHGHDQSDWFEAEQVVRQEFDGKPARPAHPGGAGQGMIPAARRKPARKPEV